MVEGCLKGVVGWWQTCEVIHRYASVASKPLIERANQIVLSV